MNKRLASFAFGMCEEANVFVAQVSIEFLRGSPLR